MEKTIFEWILQIPQTVAQFGNWLVTPISKTYLNISPLGLLGIGGTAILVSLILVHVVRLFTI